MASNSLAVKAAFKVNGEAAGYKIMEMLVRESKNQ